MKHVILAHLRADSTTARKALRLDHLKYLSAHKTSVIAGGPAVGSDGTPLTMIIFTNFTEMEAARAFIAEEPYTASGQVFEKVEILAWSQVLPEPTSGALDLEIEKELSARSSSR